MHGVDFDGDGPSTGTATPDDDDDSVIDGEDSDPFDPTACSAYRHLATLELVDRRNDWCRRRLRVDTDGFIYQDDTFRGTSEPNYADGNHIGPAPSAACNLRVYLGGENDTEIFGMSGGMVARAQRRHRHLR